MAISDWPDLERPREKLLHRGESSLSDAELLAIFLRTGIKGKTALDIARQLLKQHGSLTALLSLDRKQLCQAPGLGPAKVALLKAATEMGRRCLQEELQKGDSLNSPDSTREFLKSQLRNRQQEVFSCLFLDNRNRIIAFEELFYGTVDGASVYPREVVKRALFHNAAAIIFAHNHPSGVCQPSQADKAITEKLQEALYLIDVRVLDHFIIGEGRPCSFAEMGLL